MDNQTLQNEWPPSHEQVVEWMQSRYQDDDRGFLFKLYRSTCVWCKGHATDIHEALPRSRGKKSMERLNRFPLCRDCHRKLQERSLANLPELRRRGDVLLATFWQSKMVGQ